jgi:cyclophilin family peptidyl-prolyl cis-trans isomerase
MSLTIATLVCLLAITGAAAGAQGAPQGAAPATAPANPANPQVVLETNKGKITLELFADKAPKTVENFLGYVKSGFYNHTIFHRVIANFMIQGGGFDEQGKQKPTRPPVVNEADNRIHNERGTVAMARTADPNSASAQFFINLKDNGFLNHTGKTPQGWGYCVFGRVLEGMDTVDTIAAVKVNTQSKLSEAEPAEPIVLLKATVHPAAKK